MATSILEVLRAAVAPAAQARTGYLRGKQERTDRDEEQQRYEEQQRIGNEERAAQATERTRQAGRDTLLDQTIVDLRKAQAGADRARANSYNRTNLWGSGKNGEITERDRARLVADLVRPRLNPETGMQEQGMSMQHANDIIDDSIRRQKGGGAVPPANPGGAVGVMKDAATGKPKYISPFSARHGMLNTIGVTPDERTPQAARPDTESKTRPSTTPLTDSVRSGMTGGDSVMQQRAAYDRAAAQVRSQGKDPRAVIGQRP